MSFAISEVTIFAAHRKLITTTSAPNEPTTPKATATRDFVDIRCSRAFGATLIVVSGLRAGSAASEASCARRA